MLLSQASSIVSRRTQGIPDSQFSLRMEGLEEEEEKLKDSFVSAKEVQDNDGSVLGSQDSLILKSLADRDVASQVSLRMKPVEDDEFTSVAASSRKNDGGLISQVSLRMKPVEDDEDDLLLLDDEDSN